MRFNDSRTPKIVGDEPPKHVIDQYKHRAQEVTCVCGWHGSTASQFGGKSAWDDHKAEFRTGRS